MEKKTNPANPEKKYVIEILPNLLQNLSLKVKYFPTLILSTTFMSKKLPLFHTLYLLTGFAGKSQFPDDFAQHFSLNPSSYLAKKNKSVEGRSFHMEGYRSRRVRRGREVHVCSSARAKGSGAQHKNAMNSHGLNRRC